MKKKLIILSLSVITILTMGTTTLAKNNADTNLPTVKVNYTGIGGTAETGERRKDDTSGHYINNQVSLKLYVTSHAGGKNVTGRGYAMVNKGKWRISNYVKENGYNKCKLKIKAAISGSSGYLKGQWSPDSAGSYTYANP